MKTTVALINQKTDLPSLVGNLKRSGRYYIGPCPFCGGQDRFNIKQTDDGYLWICRRCSGMKYQDAVSFLERRDGLTFAQVLETYGRRNGKPSKAAVSSMLPIPHPTIEQPPSDDWQIPALVAVYEAAEYLRSDKPDATAAWKYLRHKRGLEIETINKATLGFNPSWRKIASGCWLAPGIVIPGMVDGELWYVQVRTTATARAESEKSGRPLDKYHALRGSRLKALYGADGLLNAHTAVITEGEFDALLLSQFLPDGVVAVTMGSAGTRPNATFLKYFASVRRAFLVMDNDEAGNSGILEWQRLLSWVETMPPLPGEANDITSSWQAGYDLSEWVKTAFRSAE